MTGAASRPRSCLDLARMRARPDGQAAGADGRAGRRRRRRPRPPATSSTPPAPTRPLADTAGAFARRAVAVVAGDDPWPHLFTPYPPSAPDELPADHLHPPLPAGDRGGGRRRWPPPWSTCWAGPGAGSRSTTTPRRCGSALPVVLARAELVDAGPLFTAVRLHKTPDELECMRRSWRDQRSGDLRGGADPAGPASASPSSRALPVRAVRARRDLQLPRPGVPDDARADRRRPVEHERRRAVQPGHRPTTSSARAT